MKFIRDIHAEKAAAGQTTVSFEFFPPRTEEGDRTLFDKTLPELLKLKPDFCSVTYGAGGSTREKTLGIVERIQKEHGLTAMSHLTCVNATKEQIRDVLLDARARGIKNILALRGDPPAGTGEFKKTEGGFEFSSQLIAFVREFGGFSIGAAGFPEGHIACKEGREVDWDRLKAKVDAGVEFIVTQLFFDNADFYAFRDHLEKKLRVSVPLVPGMLPVLSSNQIKKFAALCGSKLPAPLLTELEKYVGDDAAATEFGIQYASEQCQDLIKNGVKSLHFYTLNKAYSTTRVVQNLGLAGK